MSTESMTGPPAELLGAIASDERLLWWGRPRQGVVFRGTDVIAIPFSVLWFGFAVFWEVGVTTSDKAPWFFSLWGIPFIAVGAYFVIGRFFAESWQRSKTFYALTSERILIVSGSASPGIRSLPLNTLSDITLTERGGGGSITFGPPSSPRQRQAPCFDLTDDAKMVYERIRGAQRNSK